MISCWIVRRPGVVVGREPVADTGLVDHRGLLAGADVRQGRRRSSSSADDVPALGACRNRRSRRLRETRTPPDRRASPPRSAGALPLVTRPPSLSPARAPWAMVPVRTTSSTPSGWSSWSSASTLSLVPTTRSVSWRRRRRRPCRGRSRRPARFGRASRRRRRLAQRELASTHSPGPGRGSSSTLMSLCSCLVTWSTGCASPSMIRVMRETPGVVGRADRQVLMLKPRRAKNPLIRVSTPGLFSTRMEKGALHGFFLPPP